MIAQTFEYTAPKTLDEALELALKTDTLQRVAPVRAARAEAAWLAGEVEHASAAGEVGSEVTGSEGEGEGLSASEVAEDEIALIEPDERLLRAGGSHAPRFVRGRVDPVELLLEVGVGRLRIKENARITRVRLFRLAELNERLVRPPEFNPSDSEQLGLFVVSQLAKRHGIRVTLKASPYGGTAAIVLIPSQLVVTEDAFRAELPGEPAAIAVTQLAPNGHHGTTAEPGGSGSQPQAFATRGDGHHREHGDCEIGSA